jgi:hypothetical protein
MAMAQQMAPVSQQEPANAYVVANTPVKNTLVLVMMAFMR